MTAGPYGGAFTGDPYVPGTTPASPSVVTVDASTNSPFAATLPANSLGARLLRRVYISGPADSSARLRVGDPNDPRATRDGSSSGQEDYAEYSPGLFIPAGALCSVVWDRAAPAGTLCFASFEYQDV